MTKTRLRTTASVTLLFLNIASLYDTRYWCTLAWLKLSSIDCVLRRGNLKNRVRKRDARERNKERKREMRERNRSLAAAVVLSRLRDFNIDSLFSEMLRSCVYLIGRRPRGSPLRILVDPRSSLQQRRHHSRKMFRGYLSVAVRRTAWKNDGAVSKRCKLSFWRHAAANANIRLFPPDDSIQGSYSYLCVTFLARKEWKNKREILQETKYRSHVI